MFMKKIISVISVSVICLLFMLILLSSIALFFVKLDLSISCRGRIIPVNSAVIRTKMKGIINKVCVKENEFVKAGTLLCELSSAELETEMFQCEKNIQAVKAELERIKSRYIVEIEKYQFRLAEILAKIDSYSNNLKHHISPPSIKPDIERIENKIKSLNLEKDLLNKELEEKILLANAGITGKNEVQFVKTSISKIDIEIFINENDKMIKSNLYSEKINEFNSKKIDIENSIRELKINSKNIRNIISKLKSAEISETESYLRQLKETEDILFNILNQTGDLKIYSSISGYIFNKDTQKLAGLYLREGDQIFEIGELNDYYIESQLSEIHIPSVKRYMSVKIEIDAYPSKEYGLLSGYIDNISTKYDRGERGLLIQASREQNAGQDIEIKRQTDSSNKENSGSSAVLKIYFNKDKSQFYKKKIILAPNLSCRCDIIIESGNLFEILKKLITRKIKGATNFMIHF